MSKTLNSWHGFISSFLKVDDVEDSTEEFVCIGIDQYTQEDELKLRTMLENAKGTYMFDLNKTNARFLKNNGVKFPNDLVGKKIRFKKVLALNPRTKKEVESLRICGVE
jgi:hypothetical protein